MQSDDLWAGLVRLWIAEILQSRQDVLRIAIRQRAKFEGWLKYELAERAERGGVSGVALEAAIDGGRIRADLEIRNGDNRCLVELKTPTTNWVNGGIESKVRPITDNVSGIVTDGQKLAQGPGGVVAFTLSPVPVGDIRWHQYLDRIGGELGLSLSEESHCTRVRVALDGDHSTEVVVCAFAVLGEQLSAESEVFGA